MVRILLPHQLRRIGSNRIVGCCLSMFDGHLLRMSPLIRTMAVSRLALGRKQRTMVAGSLAEGMMGKMGTVHLNRIEATGNEVVDYKIC